MAYAKRNALWNPLSLLKAKRRLTNITASAAVYVSMLARCRLSATGGNAYENKLINFIAAMGIPVSGITTQGAGCTGICGSCSLNCAPGIVALLLLAGKAIYKRYHSGVVQHE